MIPMRPPRATKTSVATSPPWISARSPSKTASTLVLRLRAALPPPPTNTGSLHRAAGARPLCRAFVCLDHQVSAHLRKVEIACRTCMADFAPIHDVDVVGYFAAEIQELLDQEDGHALLVAQELQRPADVLDDRRLDALCGLVQHQHLGSG